MAGQRIRGLSTDVKPTTNLPAGWRFEEQNTGRQFFFDGVRWLYDQAVSGATQRGLIASYYPGSTSGGFGLTAGGFTQATGHTVTQQIDTTNGKNVKFGTGTTLGDNSGLRYVNALTLRKFNPIFRMGFRLVTTTLQRIFFGVAASFGADPTSDDPVNGTSAFMLGMRSADTVLQIFRNDGAGATDVSPLSGNPPVDALFHTIEFIMDDSVPRVLLSLDGGAQQVLTTELPGQTSTLGLIFEMETNESGVSKAFECYGVDLWSDK